MTTYRVQMIDSETPAAWMSLPGIVYQPTGQEQVTARGADLLDVCWYTVETPDALALEAALDADDDVIKYREEA